VDKEISPATDGMTTANGQVGFGAGLDSMRMPSPVTDHSLRLALEEERFVLYCQPIVEFATRTVCQHEVLLRLEEGEHHVVPGYFLPAAERFGLMPEIDRMVVQDSIAILAGGGAEVLGINLSGSSLGDPQLLEVIETDLSESGVDPSRVVFEVTESAAVKDMGAAIWFAERLSKMGCQLSLDDFGVGFGSLYYLKHLPFDFVKIDGEFVRELRTSERDRALVAGVVSMAKALDLTTVAEFVGDEETVVVLKELGVDCGQGYHLGMPALAPAAQAH
jgi:EAL domain-containing protein (putative c-di-GMP-specific phosphodiesterase class I)